MSLISLHKDLAVGWQCCVRFDGLDSRVVFGNMRQISGAFGRLSCVLGRKRRANEIAPAPVGIKTAQRLWRALCSKRTPVFHTRQQCERVFSDRRASFVALILGSRAGTILSDWELSIRWVPPVSLSWSDICMTPDRSRLCYVPNCMPLVRRLNDFRGAFSTVRLA